MENLKVYMATIITGLGDGDGDGVQTEVIVSAKNLAGIEKFLDPDQILSRATIMTNWVLADTRESYSGNYYMVDTLYTSPVDDSEENIIYLVQANNFTELEEITKEEVGESFDRIQSVEVIPHEILK